MAALEMLAAVEASMGALRCKLLPSALPYVIMSSQARVLQQPFSFTQAI